MAKLGEVGERAAGGTLGEGPIRRRRRPKKPEEVAARVARCRHEEGNRPARAEYQQGVQPLNPGVEELERMRAATVAKARSRREKKLKGDR